MKKYAVMIHGGAGALGDLGPYREALGLIIDRVSSAADSGARALDIVSEAVVYLEDDPLFNAGKGSVLNAEGQVECDASIMEGLNLNAGSVAGVTGVRNPVLLARAVMEHSPHVMMIGKGAEKFALEQGFQFEPESYFVVESRERQLKEAKLKNQIILDHSDVEEEKFGTVGAVAVDGEGNIAAATSTGGIVNKRFGRVGDTPIVGAGVYAENDLCAVSCTGYGEQLIRASVAKHIAEWMRYHEIDADQGANVGIDFLVKRTNGLGGVIVVDSKYGCAVAHSTPLILAVSKTNDSEKQFYF